MKNFSVVRTLGCTLALGLLLTGCGKPPANETPNPPRIQTNAAAAAPIDSCRVVLVPHSGASPLDEQIVKAQQAVADGKLGEPALDRLGWLFVAKARASFDNGFYKLAEHCALCLQSREPNSASARLLRGHVLHNLHRFKEAEPIARELAAQRGAPMDFGLLGDVLMELGQLDAAIQAYQQMMDLRPDSRANARAAHVRWLKGDLGGAIEAMQEAVGAVGSREPESAAWMQTRLAFYQWQAGDAALAERACAGALQLQNDYAPALLLRARLRLADGKNAEAVEDLDRAVKLNPLPEYYWALTEALTEAGQPDRANAAQTQLARRGPADDPRTYAIYLATQRTQPELALKLARQELQQRADVFTYDSLAWAQWAAGDLAAAKENITRALAEGTADARLFLHAAVIAAQSGDKVRAESFLQKTYARRHLLWPSERKHLLKTMTDLAWQPTESPPRTAWQKSSSRDR